MRQKKEIFFTYNSKVFVYKMNETKKLILSYINFLNNSKLFDYKIYYLCIL